jgi:hypothetical protein
MYPASMEPDNPKIMYKTNMGFLTKAYTASAAGIEDTAPEVIKAIAAPEVIPISIRPEIRGMAA